MDDKYYRRIIENSSFAYADHKLITDEDGNPIDYIFLDVNKAFEELTGLKKEEVLGRCISEILPIEKSTEYTLLQKYGKLILKGENFKLEFFSSIFNKWYKLEAFSRDRYYFTSIFFDITEEKKRINELNGFFDINLDLLCIASIDGRFLKLNKEWENVLGYKLDKLVGSNFFDFIHWEDLDATGQVLERLHKDEQVLNFVNRYKTKDGTYRHIEWRSCPHEDFIYASARDITDRIKIEEELRELSIRDPLTNIYNRRYIFDRLKEIEAKYIRKKESFSVAVMDIDRFKLVNDNYGHLAGDFVLQEFSKYIFENIRSFDLFGRFGGEEFILVMLNCTKNDAEKRLEIILEDIKNKDFMYQGEKINITLSCGISDNEDFDDLEIDKLIDIADRRLYKAKDLGRDRIVIENNF